MNSIKEIIEVVDIICATNGARFRPQDGAGTKIVSFMYLYNFKFLLRKSLTRLTKQTAKQGVRTK